MKFLVYGFLVMTLIVSTIQALSNTTAEEECRKIHPNIIEKSGAKFLNNGCRVECNVDGIIFSENIREGQTCVTDRKDYHCVQGCCSSITGYIVVEPISASLAEPANAFVLGWIKNDSNPVTLPIPVNDRKKYGGWEGHHAKDTIYPHWGGDRFTYQELWVLDSRITIEVWDDKKGAFLGGVSITTNQLISQNLNHEIIHLALLNGPKPGQINVRITWNTKS